VPPSRTIRFSQPLSALRTAVAELYRSPAEVEGAMTVDDLIAQYRSPFSAPAILALAGPDKVDWSAVSDAYEGQRGQRRTKGSGFIIDK
jgi:hypothetical protein